MNAPNGKAMVLVFNTCAAAHLAARLHVEGCPQAHRVRSKASVVPATQEDVDDLNERGFPVRVCKCCRAPA